MDTLIARNELSRILGRAASASAGEKSPSAYLRGVLAGIDATPARG